MPNAAGPGAPASPGRTPPFGTSQRIRNRAIWAVAFFAAAVPPALVGMGVVSTRGEEIAVGMPIALALWAIGALAALAAAFPTLRYWDGLPAQTRLLGALPMLTVSLFLTAASIGILLA
ncbi:hypothetical protein BH10PSE6_BH10PSE6_42670 [soil metagenome]